MIKSVAINVHSNSACAQFRFFEDRQVAPIDSIELSANKPENYVRALTVAALNFTLC